MPRPLLAVSVLPDDTQARRLWSARVLVLEPGADEAVCVWRKDRLRTRMAAYEAAWGEQRRREAVGRAVRERTELP